MVSSPTRTSISIRLDSLGSNVSDHDDGPSGHASTHHAHHPKFHSLSYWVSESDAYAAHCATDHYEHRGKFWNSGKHGTFMRYVIVFLIGTAQATVAYFTNISSKHFIAGKYDHVYDLLAEDKVMSAFLQFTAIQLAFAMVASIFVWIEPLSAGSGIPEVKCFLNGIDIPRVGNLRTLVTKVLGVICSVSAGLPVGKEGPMVHSGAVVATTLSAGSTRHDRETRDFVACGAAAGVCTAFSAPIGGILFSLEEGASFWGPSLTWRAFFCSMIALMMLYFLNSIGSAFGKVGFNKLFSFGNFIFEGNLSSYAVYELLLFILIGIIGGLIGAIFNDTNERITKWRIKSVNHSKPRRFIEVICVSILVSVVSFGLPFMWNKCTPLPDDMDQLTDTQVELLDELIPFGCVKGESYNEVASLIFTEAGSAIRQLFHLHRHAFSDLALFVFFVNYIGLAVIVYGIAVPSGLFVPSLLSGAAFGRLFGNLAHKLLPTLAYSNTYALVGAAAVLGGMARMTISLTVILLECTGNEQYVLPLMLTLMTARIIGGLFNDDLYHIHIHLKKGIDFLETELHSVTRHHNLKAGEIMGSNVVFFRPIEKVGVIYDILKSTDHWSFPVVDIDDNGVLFGTIQRNALCVLLEKRAFGQPKNDSASVACGKEMQNLDVAGEKFVKLVQWDEVDKSYTTYPTVSGVSLTFAERECLLDLRPYTNTAPITVQESSSIQRTYELFRNLGLRFLPVVNRHNQIVGTISRGDLTAHSLSAKMMGKKKLE